MSGGHETSVLVLIRTAMALPGCLRGINAFITVVPSGWATILRFFLFYLFWRGISHNLLNNQNNKYDDTGLAEHELKHILLTTSLIS